MNPNYLIWSLSLLSIIFVNEGCIKADDCADCGQLHMIDEEINFHSLSQGTRTSSGIARYIWYSETPDACANKTGFFWVDLEIDESKKLIPIEVSIWALSGGNIESFTVASSSGSLGSTKYFDEIEVNLLDLIPGCSGGIQARFQIDFESTGSDNSDDAYLKELIVGGEFGIDFYVPK